MDYKTQYIDQIISLFGKRNSLLPLKREDEKRLQKKYRLEFNYNSNHLEGNTLTYGQTELLLFFDKSTGDVPMSDLEEMKAHDAALSLIKEVASEKERPLTEQFIKELNKLILVRPFWKEAITSDGMPTRKKIEIGSYKTTPNSVRLRNGEIHEYASPEETPAKMNDLLSWYHENMEIMHPVQLAAEFHYRFVCIHPFDDGNGRVARLLMNYILLRFEYPMIIIKSKDKEAYLTALQKADVGHKQAIIEYIEKQMLWSLDLELKAAKGEDLEEDDDIDKEIELLRREKMETPITYKTPKVIYNLLQEYNNHWRKLSNSLKKFDHFFSEINDEILVDKRKFFKKRIVNPFRSPFIDRKLDIKPLEIFGVDLQEESINDIQWKIELQGLKSASKRIDFEVSCYIEFLEKSYSIEIILNYNEDSSNNGSPISLYEDSKIYNQYVSDEEFIIIQKEISKQLLKIIRLQK